jgi:chromosomal replication initiator protein
MSEELEHIWARVQAEIASTVDEPTYHIWLEPLRAVELSGNHLLVEAPAQACRWIRDRFGKVLHASAQLVLGADAELELTAAAATDRRDAPAAEHARARAAPAEGSRGPSSARAQRRRTGDYAPAGPLGNPKLTFDQFVIGDCNRLAHAAALTVAEMPASAYNPLFICGPPGVGKTHLLSAIGNLLLAHNPGLTVRATTGEAFTTEFIGALAAGNTDEFKARFRDVDVLLLDDVQFLEHKARTEEEFFHTFNALHDGGRQIVVTSDRPPRDLRALEERLRERFVAGLVADVTAPDQQTRLAILRMRVHNDSIHVSEVDALELIAERIDTNVRALEGALIRVVAFSSLSGRPITAELAREVLHSLYPQPSTRSPAGCTITRIQQAACEHFGVEASELVSTSRAPRLSWPRQVAMYLARELSGESLPAIARQFGGRDHTTVLYAWRRTSARIAGDEQARKTVQELLDNLAGGG